jgi:hypothetical protein
MCEDVKESGDIVCGEDGKRGSEEPRRVREFEIEGNEHEEEH